MGDSFCYQLDLVIRLVDTTVGWPVTEQQVLFKKNGQKLAFYSCGAGVHVCLNSGREDMKLTVIVKGYLETTVDIRYKELAGRYPEVYVDLIPERPKYGYSDFVDIIGNMPGITSVAAVCLTNSFAEAAAYSTRKQQMKLFAARVFDEEAYALIHAETASFEEFHVVSVRNRLFLRLAQPMETEVKPGEKISRIVRGKAEKDGNYLLRLRKDGQGMQHLIRYVVNGKTTFRKIGAESAGDLENGRLQNGDDGGDGGGL